MGIDYFLDATDFDFAQPDVIGIGAGIAGKLLDAVRTKSLTFFDA